MGRPQPDPNSESTSEIALALATVASGDEFTDSLFVRSPAVVRAKLVDDHAGGFRKVEIVSTFVFITASAFLLWRLRDSFAAHPAAAVAAFFAGWVAADLVSGVVHWAGDTWGTTEWFLVGQTLIRTFREHHVDEKAITRHDFIETNGTNCLISLPILFACLAAEPDFLVISMFSLVLWVFATNQIHKWSHQDKRPEWVSSLQRAGLILSPGHHAIHHQAPFAKYYCITTGWLNRPLTAIDFFRRSERLITRMTGAVPRAHDLATVDKVLEEAHSL